MRIKQFCTLAVVIFIVVLANAADTKPLPLVSTMFGDNMVLQRGKPIRFWGWAKPGDTIRVELNGHTTKATANKDGRWQAEIEPPPAGGPYDVTVIGSDKNVTLHNVLVGDVWLCGGQSNMQLGLAATRNAADEIKAADHPQIRLFTVQAHTAYAPAAMPQGSWQVCSPQDAGGFSAVGYFFGRKLNEELNVPIGLIQDCLGGTPAESWMSPESLRKVKDFNPLLSEIERLHAKGGPEYGSFLMHWLDEYDEGSKNGNNWAAPDWDDSKWKTVQLPSGFAELGVPDEPSICWFRKEVTLSDPLPAGKAIILLGSIEKMDTTYINGKWVGASSWVENPRAYFIGDGVLKPGKNVIAIRVFKMKPDGGFLTKPDKLKLVLGDRTEIPLDGDWKGALSADARPPHPLPLQFENYPTMPEVLYEGMIEPVAPLSISGAIWYQGEANFERAHQYRTLLPLMIGDWRAVFEQGNFPFYIVSLPAFMQRKSEPGEDSWAELREAQALTAKNVKNCALAVTVDTGEANNIHPKDKRIVGDRLALCALAKEYGKKVTFEGPTYVSMKRAGNELRLRFKHTDGGLVVKGDKLAEFSVAGKDRKWHWANAKIEGDSVIVSSPDVPEPVAARYAWQANPQATLYNGAGLPAVPFRTDDWPQLTEGRKPW